MSAPLIRAALALAAFLLCVVGTSALAANPTNFSGSIASGSCLNASPLVFQNLPPQVGRVQGFSCLFTPVASFKAETSGNATVTITPTSGSIWALADSLGSDGAGMVAFVAPDNGVNGGCNLDQYQATAPFNFPQYFVTTSAATTSSLTMSANVNIGSFYCVFVGSGTYTLGEPATTFPGVSYSGTLAVPVPAPPGTETDAPLPYWAYAALAVLLLVIAMRSPTHARREV